MANSASSKTGNWRKLPALAHLYFTPFERVLLYSIAGLLILASLPFSNSKTQNHEMPLSEETILTDSGIVHYPLDINTADPRLLELLPGIGKVLAQRIQLSRDSMPFRSMDDLMHRVKGINSSVEAELSEYITFTTATSHDHRNPISK